MMKRIHKANKIENRPLTMSAMRVSRLFLLGLLLAVLLSPTFALAVTCTCAHPNGEVGEGNCPRGDENETCNGTPVTCVGTNQNDRITGSSGDDVISGRGGRDTVRAGDGNDLVCGNRGHDKLFGNAGDDDLRGGKGNDKLRGEAGNDQLRGNHGRDNLVDREGNNTCIGGGRGNKVNCKSDGGAPQAACPCSTNVDMLALYDDHDQFEFDDRQRCRIAYDLGNQGWLADDDADTAPEFRMTAVDTGFAATSQCRFLSVNADQQPILFRFVVGLLPDEVAACLDQIREVIAARCSSE